MKIVFDFKKFIVVKNLNSGRLELYIGIRFIKVFFFIWVFYVF